MIKQSQKSIFKRAGVKKVTPPLLLFIAIFCFYIAGVWTYQIKQEKDHLQEQIRMLDSKKIENNRLNRKLKKSLDKLLLKASNKQSEESIISNDMLSEYQPIYANNNDFIGWLFIKDTPINYPVMQTPNEEDYYLNRGFDKQINSNGCLVMSANCRVGIGTKQMKYQLGEVPSTNLIIHGHNMKSGEMFGNLKLFKDSSYCKAHNLICFDTLYEKREYKVVSVFLSQVYKKCDDVFKYYKFINAYNEDQFNAFYNHIKQMALFDTGVTTRFGDEYITLSTCSSHVKNGRLVVVGKRVK